MTWLELFRMRNDQILYMYPRELSLLIDLRMESDFLAI